ncbi:interleukin-8-like [Anabas testudineus]|uniref:Chemokine interleukin-8-like domain-containing protein n=1 Tax=Anabas testudineus TaxID=64144 RepID=A0A7N6BV56_ANATE|nr:interleukin-8-like [Anabas testudineus]
MSVILLLSTLLVFLTITEGIGPGDHGETLRCRCIIKEKRPIGRYIGEVKVNPASSHCRDVEIIATLKKDGKKICLNPDAPWVKKVLQKIRAVQQIQLTTDVSGHKELL